MFSFFFIATQLMFSFFFIAVTVPILPLSSRCCRRRRLVSAAVDSVHVCRSIWRTLINLVQRIFPSSSLWTTAAHFRHGEAAHPGVVGITVTGHITGTIRIFSLRAISDRMPPSGSKSRSRHSPKSAQAFAICGASFVSILRALGKFWSNRWTFAALGAFRHEGAPAVGLSTAQVARCIFTSFWCWTLNCILKSCN